MSAKKLPRKKNKSKENFLLNCMMNITKVIQDLSEKVEKLTKSKESQRDLWAEQVEKEAGNIPFDTINGVKVPPLRQPPTFFDKIRSYWTGSYYTKQQQREIEYWKTCSKWSPEWELRFMQQQKIDSDAGLDDW